MAKQAKKNEVKESAGDLGLGTTGDDLQPHKENPLTFTIDDKPEIDYDAKYGDRMPYIGETVHFEPSPDDQVARRGKNTDPVAAMVTKVRSSVCVDLKIIPNFGPMQDRKSVSRRDASPDEYYFDYIEHDL